MKLPVYDFSRRIFAEANCSTAVFVAYVVARALLYVCLVAAAMLLPRRAGIIVSGISTAYIGAVTVDGLLPMVFLWAGLIHLPEEKTPPEQHPCWCASCTATRTGDVILSLAALKNDVGEAEEATELRGFASRIDAMFPETIHGDDGAPPAEMSLPKCAQCGDPCDGDPRTHQGPCTRDGLVFCSTLCSMAHKRDTGTPRRAFEIFVIALAVIGAVMQVVAVSAVAGVWPGRIGFVCLVSSVGLSIGRRRGS